MILDETVPSVHVCTSSTLQWVTADESAATTILCSESSCHGRIHFEVLEISRWELRRVSQTFDSRCAGLLPLSSIRTGMNYLLLLAFCTNNIFSARQLLADPWMSVLLLPPQSSSYEIF